MIDTPDAQVRHSLLRWLDTQLPLRRLRFAALLTPAFYLLTVWILALSASVLLDRYGVVAMLGWALLAAFDMAYSLVLFLSEWERGRESAANASVLSPSQRDPTLRGS